MGFIIKLIVKAALVLCFLIAVLVYFFVYPRHFSPHMVTIEDGTTINSAGEELNKDDIISSSLLFKIIFRLEANNHPLIAGDYLFSKPEPIFSIIYRLGTGDFQMEQKKVVIPEGSTNIEISEYIKKTYPDFNADEFLAKAASHQGYLFPATYFFHSTSTDKILQTLEDNFNARTKDLRDQVQAKGIDFGQVVTIASILEEEAKNKDDFAQVSNILWKRLNMGMALQVDAVPSTYSQKGLPAAPASNPGLFALEAAANPQPTDYLYYLTGSTDGLMHYAKTFEEHVANEKKYLK